MHYFFPAGLAAALSRGRQLRQQERAAAPAQDSTGNSGCFFLFQHTGQHNRSNRNSRGIQDLVILVLSHLPHECCHSIRGWSDPLRCFRAGYFGSVFTFRIFIFVISFPPSLTPFAAPVNFNGMVAITFLSSTSSRKSRWLRSSVTLSNWISFRIQR